MNDGSTHLIQNCPFSACCPQALLQRGFLVPGSRVPAGAGQREGLHEVVAAAMLPRLLHVLCRRATNAKASSFEVDEGFCRS